MKCDFCCGEYVVWMYEVRPFTMLAKGDLGVKMEAAGLSSAHYMSSGWAACVTCKGLVDRGDIDGLVLFAAACMKNAPPVARGMLRSMFEPVMKTRDAGRPVNEAESKLVTPSGVPRPAVPSDLKGHFIELSAMKKGLPLIPRGGVT